MELRHSPLRQRRAAPSAPISSSSSSQSRKRLRTAESGSGRRTEPRSTFLSVFGGKTHDLAAVLLQHLTAYDAARLGLTCQTCCETFLSGQPSNCLKTSSPGAGFRERWWFGQCLLTLLAFPNTLTTVPPPWRPSAHSNATKKPLSPLPPNSASQLQTLKFKANSDDVKTETAAKEIPLQPVKKLQRVDIKSQDPEDTDSDDCVILHSRIRSKPMMQSGEPSAPLHSDSRPRMGATCVQLKPDTDVTTHKVKEDPQPCFSAHLPSFEDSTTWSQCYSRIVMGQAYKTEIVEQDNRAFLLMPLDDGCSSGAEECDVELCELWSPYSSDPWSAFALMLHGHSTWTAPFNRPPEEHIPDSVYTFKRTPVSKRPPKATRLTAALEDWLLQTFRPVGGILHLVKKKKLKNWDIGKLACRYLAFCPQQEGTDATHTPYLDSRLPFGDATPTTHVPLAVWNKHTTGCTVGRTPLSFLGTKSLLSYLFGLAVFNSPQLFGQLQQCPGVPGYYSPERVLSVLAEAAVMFTTFFGTSHVLQCISSITNKKDNQSSSSHPTNPSLDFLERLMLLTQLWRVLLRKETEHWRSSPSQWTKHCVSPRRHQLPKRIRTQLLKPLRRSRQLYKVLGRKLLSAVGGLLSCLLALPGLPVGFRTALPLALPKLEKALPAGPMYLDTFLSNVTRTPLETGLCPSVSSAEGGGKFSGSSIPPEPISTMYVLQQLLFLVKLSMQYRLYNCIKRLFYPMRCVGPGLSALPLESAQTSRSLRYSSSARSRSPPHSAYSVSVSQHGARESRAALPCIGHGTDTVEDGPGHTKESLQTMRCMPYVSDRVDCHPPSTRLYEFLYYLLDPWSPRTIKILMAPDSAAVFQYLGHPPL